MMSDSEGGQRHDRTALVLFGTETGNSQDVAEDLGRMMERLRFETIVREMDAVQVKELIGFTVVLFVLPTTGQGEFPRNARRLWKSLLLKRLPSNLLENLPFTVFGLGDSSYAQFNWAARKLQRRLEQLGANDIYPRGEADDQHPEGYDGTFLPWKLDLRQKLLSSYPLPDGVAEIPPDVALPPKIRLRLVEGSDSENMGARLSSFEDCIADRTVQPSDLDGGKNGDEVPKTGNQRNLTSSHPRLGPTIKLSYKKAALSSTREAMENPVALAESTLLWTPSAHQDEPDGRSHLKEASNDPSADDHLYIPPPGILPIPDGLDATLVENRRVTPAEHWQDVRLLTFHIPSFVPFGAGCSFKIWPKNFPEDVQSLINLQGWGRVADLPISFERSDLVKYGTHSLARDVPGLYASHPVTLRNLLIHNLDINAIPRRSFFELIAMFTDDEVHRTRLLEFTNPYLSEEFFDYTSRPRRSILEVLHDFPSVRLPWTDVTTIFPIIKPRAYSLASVGTQALTDSPHWAKIEILVALVKYQTVLKKIRQGLCSRYLASLRPGSFIRGKLEYNEKFLKVLNPTAHPERPALMIAPGTGIAPCRALLWERASHRFMRDIPPGKNVLIFGNRNRRADFFFEHELMGGYLNVKLFTAFSRDQKEKIYVQDIVRREGSLIYELLREKAVVYVCGSSGKMPKAIKEAILQVMIAYGGPTGRNFAGDGLQKDCEEWLKRMEKDCEYVQETW